MRYHAPRYLFRRYEILNRIEPGETFLEIGPGNLNLTVDLVRYFDRGTLVELNPDVEEAYEAFDDMLRARLDLIIGDFSVLPLEEQHYDCVIACEVMEHVEDDKGFLEKAVKLLRPGGQIVLSVPARLKYWGVDDEVVGHFRRYERESLRRLIQVCGLKNIEIASYGYPFVNLLRIPRTILARYEYDELMKLSRQRRSEKSSQVTRAGWTRSLNFLINPKTFGPLTFLSSLLTPLSTRFDLTDGYLATGTRD